MSFRALKKFLLSDMRMSHIYQPVMIKALLARKGQCSTREIAREILGRDDSQIEYYERITKEMPGRVLSKHGIVTRNGKEYALQGFAALEPEQVRELSSICDDKILEYVNRRGARVWDHRRVSSGYVPGTLRYEVLKRAQFHCELCGVPADERALEVDHRLPRKRGGIDAIENLQALCYSCNATKRDRDDTDFRAVRESYTKRDASCIFCNLSKEREILGENSLAVAFTDAFPVSPLHALVIPRRHVRDFFEMSQPETNACTQLLAQIRGIIQSRDSAVAGFNIGANVDEAGGQSVFHCHIHLIPRRQGDVPNPRGGVRHIIPGKGNY
jgi:diadenosine tetraphosphate (Ap4A) HIT family hydrolase